MLICGPFHSITHPPVGMAYLSAYLKKHGIECTICDLNIQGRETLLRTMGNQPLVNRLFTPGTRTFIAEVLAWSWHLEGGTDEIINRIASHPNETVHRFWQAEGLAELATDADYIHAGQVLRTFLEDQARRIANAGHKWIGLSTTITNLPANLFLARCLKKENPNLFIIMGGPQITRYNAEKLLTAFPYMDAAITAPAYEPLKNLILSLELSTSPPLTPGTWRRWHDGKIKGDNRRCEIDLDTLPPADWQGINWDLYYPAFIIPDTDDSAPQPPIIPIHTTQGCSYNACDFCYNTALYSGFKAQSPHRVLTEIRYQMDHVESKGFFFTDFEFNARPNRIRQICSLLNELPEKICFYAWLRLDGITADLLEMIYIAGGRQLFIGVEAVDNHLLKLMNKGYTADCAMQKLELLHRFCRNHPDFDFAFNLIAGYPGEHLESVEHTLAMVSEHFHLFEGRVAAVVDFMLHAHTPAYRRLKNKGVGFLEPLLPSGVDFQSYYYLLPEEPKTAERQRIWETVRSLLNKDASSSLGIMEENFQEESTIPSDEMPLTAHKSGTNPVKIL